MRACKPIAVIALIALFTGVALAIPAGALAPRAAAAAPAAAALLGPPTADQMPGDVPSRKTPWVLDGEVYKIVQVGNTMIAGGLFTQVADPMNGTPYARQNLVAFDATTGVVSQTFNPTVDGAVQQLMPGPTADTVYVAGDFTKINNNGPNHIQLLNINTGQAVASFKAPSTAGSIQTMELLPNNRLFIGGFFKQIAGNPYGQFATLNATTGALDPFMNFTAAGNHNTGSGAKAPIGPREAALTPAGDRLVVVGNYRTVGGIARDQIVMIDLTGASAVVSPDWYTTQYTPICSPNTFDSYMRDVEMSPDGSFFVVSTTGGTHSGTLCDTASRFETYAVGTAQTATWSNASGGDTLWGVEITQSAVYVGGHNRWMNNPSGSDRAAQGAVPRPGLVALDPQNGIPLKWNPGRNPRGEAAYEIYETEAGLWVVSDTDFIGDNRYQRPRIAFFPYNEGTNTASTGVGSLPGEIYVGDPAGSAPALTRVINFDGTSITSQTTATTFDWTDVRDAVMIGRTLFYAQSDNMLYRRSFDGATFGDAVQVNPYLDPLWSTVLTGSGPTGQTYAGALPSWYGQLSAITGMFYANGRIYYTLTGQNSLYWRGFSPDSGIIGGIENTVTGGNITWSSTKGMFLAGTNLYVVSSTNGQLLKIGFVNGAPTGTSTVADTTTDWRGQAIFLASVLPNVAPTAAFTSECTGVSCTFDASGSSDSDGTVQSYEWTFSDGDEAGGPNPEKDFADTGTYDVTLTVTDDGGLTSSVTHEVSVVKPNVPPTAAFSTTCDYLACSLDATASTDGDGTVDDYAWDFGDGQTGTGSQPDHTYQGPGTYTITLVVTDDDGATDDISSEQTVVGGPTASTPPTASFIATCDGVVCAFDGTDSSDSDGSVVSYAWDFGDGAAVTGGPQSNHSYGSAGQFVVTLTVTDNDGNTSSASRDISPGPAVVAPAPAVAGDRVQPEFFGIDLAIGPDGAQSWPEFDPGAVRIAQPWSAIERTRGVYDWAHLDMKVATAESHRAVPLIVLQGTPTFHALDATPRYGSPPDLSAYRSFVRALVARYGARIDYHVWNEANVKGFFSGTPAQMAAMTRVVGEAVHDLAPAATVVAPSFSLRGDRDAFRAWFKRFWAQKVSGHRVGDFVDAASVSAYPMPDQDPEDSIELTKFARRVLHQRGFDGPLWATEINYGVGGQKRTRKPISMKRQVSYVVRTFVLHANAGTQRVYWWRWEPHKTVNTVLNNGKGGLTPAGTAFGVVQDWLVGTKPTSCKTRKGVRTCGFRVSSHVTRYVSWSRSGRTRSVRAPRGARTRTKASGVARKIEPRSRLRIGHTPVMVETRTR